MTLYKFLFPAKPDNTGASLLLLAVRIIFGFLLLSHGVQKWMNFETMANAFPDPLGVGTRFSLILAIFAELFCSLGFIFGFLYRLVLIPMIFTMAVAFFVIHAQDPFTTRELAFAYLVIFLLMYIAGPGKYALDRIFVRADPS